MDTLTAHFTWEDVVRSDKATELGINNTLPQNLVGIVINTANGIERVRSCIQQPMHVNSWYRCAALNTAVGSHDTSQHMKGEAVDFISSAFGTPLEICKAIIENRDEIKFDQLILEHTWIHISFCGNPSAVPRNMVLSLLATGKYAIGLTNTDGVPYE